MLNKFVQAKYDEINNLKKMEDQGIFPCPYNNQKPKLSKSLKQKKGIIAEYKIGSPSMGIINKNFDVCEVIMEYVENGAVGVSVITEKKYFYADLDLLNKLQHINVPILRKDFIIDPIQVKYTATTPASSILLIVKLFKDKYDKLLKLIDYSYLLGLEPVVEINDAYELEIARKSGAKLFLINNRNLDTLEVDINTSKNLISKKQDKEIWISASGISSPKTVKEMLKIGYDGCLIGTYFMKHKDPAKVLGYFVKELD